MRNALLSRVMTPCIMLVMLIFCSQQGYVVYKDYKKVTNKLANADKPALKKRDAEKNFALFTAAVRQSYAPVATKAPLSAEIEGIIRSDESWLSFAVRPLPGSRATGKVNR